MNASSPDNMQNAEALLIGADGMLGRAWAQLLEARGIACKPTTSDNLDICDAAQIEQWISPQITHVINCAAWTDVDGAEAYEAQATNVNGHAVRLLAERCKTADAKLVHYSTDYVFNGEGNRPYRVDDPVDPVNAYGRGKLVGERHLAEVDCRYLVIRTSWLYAPWGKNFVDTIARLSFERDELNVVDDQRGRPTSCEHLARASLALMEKGAEGIYHVNDGGECTWFEFASEIVRLAGSDCDVKPCASEAFPRPAKRPAYSVMDLSQTENLVGPMPHWKDNLRDVMQRMTFEHTASET